MTQPTVTQLALANARGEYGIHGRYDDPEAQCPACEAYNEACLRAGGWTEQDLEARRTARRAAGEVTTQ